MKMIDIIKKNKLLSFVILAYIVIFIVTPDMGIAALGNSGYYLLEMLQILPVIFLLTVVIDVLVPKEAIIQGFGEGSGFKGNLLALLLGSVSAGPIYAAFPISKMLLKKGASISNIVIILSAWAVVKVPMLANEVKFLGINFMMVRWILTVISIFIMAYIIGMIVKKEDLPAMIEEGEIFEINEDYCIGCGLCVEMNPEYYEMGNNKAIVKKYPVGVEDRQIIRESVKKCPANAISLNENQVVI